MCGSVKVLKGGVCTTVQDLGRIGFQKFGMPVAGVMDEFAASVANFLAGNDRGEAVLEVSYFGLSLEFQEAMMVGIAGADLGAKLNGTACGNWRSIHVQKGDVLNFSSLRSGARCYAAFAGSIDVPFVSGSRSTLMKSKIGGLDGRMLQAGDVLSVHVRTGEKERRLADEFIPKYAHSAELSVCLGPQDDYFTEKGIRTFFETPYYITARASRMGICLDGEKIEHKERADIISDAVVIGSIQVPADGKPIVLMADRQTTGGYPKIATVIKADIGKLAQMGLKDCVQFRRISVEDAQKEYRLFYHRLEEIRQSLL